MSKKLLLIGGGGHCKTVIEAIESSNSYDEMGIIDIQEKIGQCLLNLVIIGTDQELRRFREAGFTDAFISMGSIGNPQKRIKLFELTKALGYKLPIITDLSANISHYAKIAEGSFIGKNVIINADAVIGKCAILNTGSIIEHDCSIGDFAHIAPGAVLNGHVTIGQETHIGANCTVRQNCHVGDQTIIGMGSVVVSDIESKSIAFGNPCRKVENK